MFLFLTMSLLIVIQGLFGILKQLLHLSARVRQTEEERREENLRQSPTQTLLNCFMLGWFIIGKFFMFFKKNTCVENLHSIFCSFLR